MQIAGESLFNDGVGVVLFMGLLEVAAEGGHFDLGHMALLFVHEAVGGLVFGLAIGFLAYRMLKSVDDYQVEILLSLALVVGGSSLADALHLSAPIAMVVAGLLIGNHGRSFAMSREDHRAPRPVLGAGRRDAQRRAVRGDRPGAARA